MACVAASHASAASFAKQSLFLSQETVNEGDTVFVYAVVTNDTSNYFSGKLVFSDEHGPIGTTTIGLEADRANTFSVTWKPAAGSHTIAANLLNGQGDVVESENSDFFVNAKPKPAEAGAPSVATQSDVHVGTSTIASSLPIEKSIASLSPQVAAYTAPVFTSIDAGRAKAATSFTNGSNWSKQQIAKSALQKPGFATTLWLILSTVALYACTVVLYMLSNIGVFYPILALVFFFVLWKSYRLVRR